MANPPIAQHADQTFDPRPDFQSPQLINTLSSSLLNPPTSQNITASKAWSLRSLQLADRALEEDGAGKSVCERARIVAEFNLGALLEVSIVYRHIPELVEN
jgi:hypothetical protein